MDLAELGLQVDSKPVKSASDVLDDFANSAGKAENAADDFRKGAEGIGSASDQMTQKLDAAAEGFNWLALGAAAAATAVGAALVSGFSSSISRIEEENKLLAQFDQALKNVGNTANTSSAEFKEFADQLEDSTGRAAEEILGIGSNLATFGFSNDVFYKSIELANDMAAAWGGDLRSSMEGLGRALDDPIAGFAMLQKRGISLTDEQAALVQQLVDTNQKLEAQRYIIDVLNEQVGGVAEAGFTGFAAATQRMGKAIEDFFDAITEGTGLIDLLSAGMNAAATAINFVTDNLSTLAILLAPVGVAIAAAFGPVAVSTVLSLAAALSGPLLAGISAVTVALMANPFGLVAAGVAAAIAIIVKFREQLGLTDERLQAIGEVGSRVFNIVSTAVSKMYETVGPMIEAVYDRLSLWGSYIAETLTPVFQAMYDTVAPILQGIADWIDRILSGLEQALGISRQVSESTPKGESSGAAGSMQKAIETGGKSASQSMQKAVDTGGKSASQTMSAAAEKTGRGYATALERANESSAAMLEDGLQRGGDKAASALDAMATVMSAKFEGTGRNIYDLWNNWGDSFIDSFQTSIGELLVSYQKAQTELINQQAKLAKEQASYYRAMTDDLKQGGSGSSSRSSGSASSSMGYAGSVGSSSYSGGSGGDTIGGSTSLYHGGRMGPLGHVAAPETEATRRYASGEMASSREGVLDKTTTYINPQYSASANPEKKVEVVIVNQVSDQDLLNSMESKAGKQIISNIVRTNQ